VDSPGRRSQGRRIEASTLARDLQQAVTPDGRDRATTLAVSSAMIAYQCAGSNCFADTVPRGWSSLGC
jgi:hypothetical protein